LGSSFRGYDAGLVTCNFASPHSTARALREASLRSRVAERPGGAKLLPGEGPPAED
jgi:hypothetical protein